MVLVTLLGQWGAPQAQKMARDLRAFSTYGALCRYGLVCGPEMPRLYLHSKIDDDKLYGLNMWRFNSDKQLETVVYAEQVDYLSDNNWLMKNVQVTEWLMKLKYPRQSSRIPLDDLLAPDKLAVVTVKPEELSLGGLFDYVVHYLKDSEQDSSRYELALWRKVTQPFSIAVMMLMALSFIFGPLRSVTMGAAFSQVLWLDLPFTIQ